MRLGGVGRDVLAIMAASPAEQYYGLQLCLATKRASGTLYPALGRLEELGLLSSSWEDSNPSDEKRPRRRYYELTPDGRIAAAAARAELRFLVRPTLKPAT